MHYDAWLVGTDGSPMQFAFIRIILYRNIVDFSVEQLLNAKTNKTASNM